MEERKYEYTSMKVEPSIFKQFLIVGWINLSLVVVGYSVGWSSPTIPKLKDPATTPLDEPITDYQASWLASLLYIGSMSGPYVTSILANQIGRKPCLLIGGLINCVAYILVITTSNLAMVYALRVISGLGMGITIVSNIIYIGEIASTHIRGILLTSTAILNISGTVLVYSVVPYVSYAVSGWIALAISVLHVVGVYFIAPESPLYYAIKKNDAKVAKTLNYLGRGAEIEKVLENVNKKEVSNKLQDWTELLTIKSNRKSLFISAVIGTLQQISGISVVLFFATTIFEMAGSSVRPDIATIIIGVTRLVSSLLALTFVERSGRKILLMLSTLGCSISLFVLGSYFYFVRVESPVISSIGWLPLVALIVYFFSFAAGFGTIPNALVGEMFRSNVRANGTTLAITSSWAVGFGVTSVFNSMIITLGSDVTFWIFSTSCFIAFLFTYFVIPETKGKTLKEIEDMMS